MGIIWEIVLEGRERCSVEGAHGPLLVGVDADLLAERRRGRWGLYGR